MSARILYVGLIVVSFPLSELMQQLQTSAPLRLQNVLDADKMLTARSCTLYVQAQMKPPHLKALSGARVAVAQTKDGLATPADQLTNEQWLIEGTLVLVWVTSRNGRGRVERAEDHLTIRKGMKSPQMLNGVISHPPISTSEQNKGLGSPLAESSQ